MKVKDNKLKSRPPQKSVEDFIAEAENKTKQPLGENPVAAEPKSYPWEDEKVREDVIKAVNLRLPEPYILKLQYLSEQTNKSQQLIIREILCPEIDRIITEMKG